MTDYYTCVGSRGVPQNYYDKIVEFSALIASLGLCLRSGGAPGSDTAAEDGCISANGMKQIFHPWPGFNKDRPSQYTTVCERALEIAKTIHPNWAALSHGARQLHGRNVYQVLGPNLYNGITPSRFLVCWTPRASDVGGTRTAIVLARRYKIPVFNIADPDQEYKLFLELIKIRSEISEGKPSLVGA